MAVSGLCARTPRGPAILSAFCVRRAPDDQLEGGTAGAQARRRGAPAGRQATGAFGNDAAECAARYCEGEGREGRRSAQMRVRKSWICCVRMALSQWAKPWTELPRGRADYIILEAGLPNE
jgi:hypothetical protein